jgi:hypothetical protein
MHLSWDRNWTSSGTGIGPVLGQGVNQIWYQIWPRSGTRFGPDLGPDLAPIWVQIWPRSGTRFGPDRGQNLTRIWAKFGTRSGTENGAKRLPKRDLWSRVRASAPVAQPVGDAAQQRAVPGSNPGRPRDWKSASADGNVFQRPPKFGATTREKTCTHHTLVSPRRTLVPSTLSAAVSQRIGARGGGNGADETFVYCIRRHGESATRTNFKNRKRETAELRARKKCCAFLPKGSEGGLAPPDCLRGLGRLNAG